MWDEAKALAKAGRIEEIPAELYVKYYATFRKLESDFAPPPKDLPPGTICGWWYWGEAGTGKSYQARIDFPGAYLKIPQNKWWDGYNGEENVIIEDFDPEDKYMGKYFKQWCDEKVFRVELKHGGKVIRPKRICITSNWRIDQCWLDDRIVKPMQRRFHEHEFTEVIDQSLMPRPEKRQRIADGVQIARETALRANVAEIDLLPELDSLMGDWGGADYAFNFMPQSQDLLPY